LNFFNISLILIFFVDLAYGIDYKKLELFYQQVKKQTFSKNYVKYNGFPVYSYELVKKSDIKKYIYILFKGKLAVTNDLNQKVKNRFTKTIVLKKGLKAFGNITYDDHQMALPFRIREYSKSEKYKINDLIYVLCDMPDLDYCFIME